MADANDGVLAIAGLAEGLSLATSASIGGIIAIAAFAGAVSVAGVKYTEEAAEREVQQDLVREERRLLELSPAEEMDELTAHFRSKGVSEETARKVAEELSAADALSAQLETEYGISEVMSVTRPFTEALGSAAFFLIGAVIPILVSTIVPRPWVDEFILLGVAISLTVTSLILARFARTRVLPTIGRSLLIGTATMGAAALVGTLFS